MFRYSDGSPEALRVLLHCLPKVAAEEACKTAGGYVPTLPWLIELLDESPVYKRMTQTEQHEFHWANADFAKEALE